MRDIKYRIWHKPTKTMQQVAVISFVNGYVDTFGSKLYPEPIYGIPFDEIELMQYCGFNDIKNNYAYENDIIRIDHFIDARNKKHYLYKQISWSECRGMFIFKHLDGLGTDGAAVSFIFESQQYPIIAGNSLENPDLMEAK